MFPWVYGFQWSFGYLVFLGVFFTVAMVVAATLVTALWRSFRDFRRGTVPRIQWESSFHDLPARERPCRHNLTGEMSGRVCELSFDCRECQTHARFVEARTPDSSPVCAVEVPGLEVPMDRLYHRGHTWVQRQSDRTVLVGLDEIGKRIAGKPDRVTLPAPGDRLVANGPAMTIRRHGSDVRILAPIDGVVMETAPAGQDWLLRVDAGPEPDTRHLLCGREVHAWLLRELERLQLSLSATEGAPSLADGGVLVDDLGSVCTPAQWDAVSGAMFLDV